LSPSVGSKRTRTPAPRRLAPLGKTELPGNECLRSPPIRASPDRLSARTRRNRKANLTIVPHPLREPQIEANPGLSARRTFNMEASLPSRPVRSLEPKQAPILPPPGLRQGSKPPVPTRWQLGLEANLDPSAAGSRDEKRTPCPRSFAAPARSKLRFLAAGPSTEARTLQHPARSRHRPKANLLPFAARSSARGQAPEPRPFAASIRSKPRPRPPDRMRTEILPQPVSRTFQIEANPDPSSRRT